MVVTEYPMPWIHPMHAMGYGYKAHGMCPWIHPMPCISNPSHALQYIDDTIM